MSSEPKIARLIAGLKLIAPKVVKVEWQHSSGMAMFHTRPLTDAEQLALVELGWSAGEHRAGIDDGGPWQ